MASATPQTAWLPPRGTHNISIGSSVRRLLSREQPAQSDVSQTSRNDFVAMRYNLKPPAVANAAGSLLASGSHGQRETYQLELKNKTGERHSFSARAEAKKEVDCVLFYDAETGTLVLERLDSLLSLTHQRSPAVSNAVQSSLPLNRPSPTPATAFPPTPPSTSSPPEYAALPEANRQQKQQQQQKIPRGHGQQQRVPHVHAGGQSGVPAAEKGPASFAGTSADTPASVASTSSSSPSARKAQPQSMSDYAQDRRKSHDSRSHQPKRSTASDFASEPDEETLTFGKATITPESSSNTMPSSNNALRLTDIPSRREKRKFSDSEPDEEVLEFGRPAQEIKRAKTASQSPASISHGTPVNAASDLPTEIGSSRSQPYQTISSRLSAGSMNKLVHGSSPLATAQVLPSDSGSEDEDEDSSDSETEAAAPSFVPSRHNDFEVVHDTVMQSTEADGDEEDFLAAAFNDGTNATHDDAASDHSGDSSDESDYGER